MQPETLLIAALATYRLSLLISKEEGPFDMFGRLRSALGVRFDEYSKPYPTNTLSAAVLCPYCLSAWIAGAIALFIATGMLTGHLVAFSFVLLPLALSGASVFLFKWTGV